MKNLSKLPQMKCICAVVLLLTMGFTFSESASQCVTPPSGLVSWWPGDGNANDIQSSNHGTLQNGATFATGKVGQAFSFDGVDDGINIPKSGNLDFGASDFSIGAWVNFTEDFAGPNHVVIFDNYAGLPFYRLFINPFGEYAGVYFRDNLGNAVVAEGATPLNDGNWHYLVGIRDGQNGHIYIDGTLVATASHPSVGTITTSTCTYARIGATNTGPGHCSSTNLTESYFKGLIDEIEIYNRALTASEIQSIYNAGSAGKCTNTPPPVCVNPPSGLISWWRGENDANDFKGGNHGTLQNWATFAVGKVDQAFSFDGIDDVLEVNDAPSLKPANAITVDAWIYWRGPQANYNRILTKRRVTSVGGISYHLVIVGNKLFWGINVSGGITGSAENVSDPNDFPTNTWHHVAGTYDGTSLRLFIDGIEVASRAQSGSIAYDTDPLVIGWYDSNFGEYFDGLIDEVEIFNRALSSSEIQSIYNAGSAGKCKECEPPTADAGDDQTICPNASVQIGGDPTGSGGSGTLSFSWEPADGLSAANVANPTATPTSTTTYTVTVTDANGCTATAEMTVTVEDNQAPVITVAANPITLWPPNHQYVTINASQCVMAVTDNCATLSSSDVVITQVTSDEPEDAKGGGDGNTLNDMEIASNCQSVQLRSERQGSSNGRVYTIHLSVNDGNGNTGTATCLVTVPKSQNGNPAINDGPVYTANGNCSGAAKFAENTSNAAKQEILPEGYALFQNYPNPFNPTTEITFALPEAGKVAVSIYSETGQLVRTLVDNEMPAGQHVVSWNGLNESGNTVAAGVYLYRIVVQKQNGETAFTETRRMTLLK